MKSNLGSRQKRFWCISPAVFIRMSDTIFYKDYLAGVAECISTLFEPQEEELSKEGGESCNVVAREIQTLFQQD